MVARRLEDGSSGGTHYLQARPSPYQLIDAFRGAWIVLIDGTWSGPFHQPLKPLADEPSVSQISYLEHSQTRRVLLPKRWGRRGTTNVFL